MNSERLETPFIASEREGATLKVIMVSLLFFIPVFPIIIITSYYPRGQAEKLLALAAFPPPGGRAGTGRQDQPGAAEKKVLPVLEMCYPFSILHFPAAGVMKARSWPAKVFQEYRKDFHEQGMAERF
jgi:hypothetical protein